MENYDTDLLKSIKKEIIIDLRNVMKNIDKIEKIFNSQKVNESAVNLYHKIGEIANDIMLIDNN